MHKQISSVNETSGYWENVTATIDWCEINYEVTYYVAEFWNTISNLVMILLPIYCIYWSLRQKTGEKLQKYTISNSLKFCLFALSFVGLGLYKDFF